MLRMAVAFGLALASRRNRRVQAPTWRSMNKPTPYEPPPWLWGFEGNWGEGEVLEAVAGRVLGWKLIVPQI